MRKQIAHQTLPALLAWLLFQNFNVFAGNVAPLHAGCPEFAVNSGKCTESLCIANHPADYLRQPAGILPAYRIKKVVLDAGHGGKDPGCIGASSKEKHNALAIVLKLGALIEAEYPGIEVIYTRKTDVFIELNERAAIANRNNADLFISVHCNSISVSHVKGTETYVMGLHTADHNLEVAKRENASIFLEDNYQKNYAGYDPDSPEAHILGSVWQSAYLEQSILFASFVQKYAREIASREDKGVKQAGFLVLRETAMPSVLVEAGYLTNRGEENFIASDEGQTQMAESVFEAFRAYKAQMEAAPLTARVRTAPPSQTAKSAQAAVLASNEQPVNAKPDKKQDGAAPKPTTPGHGGTAVAEPVSIRSNPATAKTQPNTYADVYADEVLMPVVSKKAETGGFRIHLLSWTSRLDKNAGQLSLIGGVEEERANGQFHYFTGTFATRAEAEKMLPELTNLGFRTAKVVALNTQNN